MAVERGGVVLVEDSLGRLLTAGFASKGEKKKSCMGGARKGLEAARDPAEQQPVRVGDRVMPVSQCS